jgi:hypothetical protein
VSKRSPAVRSSAAGPEPPDAGAPPTRNRWTAVGLVAWILGLMLASAVVAWLRN